MSDALDSIAERYRVEEDFDSVLAHYGVGLISERRRGDSLLELGCGDGLMTKGFAPVFPQIVAVDGSEVCVERACRNAPGAKVMHSMLESFETPKRFTDITLVRVLEHLDDPPGMLRRAAAWLRPGGRIHIVVPNAYSLKRQLGVEMGMMPNVHHLHERDVAHGHKQVYDMLILLAHISQAGLTVRHTEGIMLKPLSNAQMKTWDPGIIKGLFVLGRKFPGLATEIYAECVRGAK